MAIGTRSLPTGSPVPYFQPIERGHVSEGIPSDIGSPRHVPHVGMQISPHHTNLGEIPYLPLQVVLNTILLFLNQIDCLPTLYSMTMIPCLRLDMVGE